MTDLIDAEKEGNWTFVPQIPDFDNETDTFSLMTISKFGATWSLNSKFDHPKYPEYVDIEFRIDGNWGIAHELSGRIQWDYGGEIYMEEFDINKKREIVFENVCSWSEFERRVMNDTQFHVSIWIDKEYGIDMRRTRKYEKDGLTDGLIVTKTHKFHVSKAMMSLHSPFFLHQFQKSSEIELDIDGETVEAMLDMIHPPFVLPKNWVEWEEFYIEDRSKKNKVKEDDDSFVVNGRLSAAKIRKVYDTKYGYYPNYCYDLFLDETVDQKDEKAENNKFGATSKYRILAAAKKLQLSGVTQMTKTKFINEIVMYDRMTLGSGKKGTSGDIRLTRWSSFELMETHTNLPINADKSRIQVFGSSEFCGMFIKFIGTKWQFKIAEINEDNEEVIREGEGLTVDQWKERKEKLAEDYYFVLLSFWEYKLVDVKGTITVRFKGSKIVELRRNLCQETENWYIYVGKLTKKMLAEEDATITITISVDTADRRDAQRKYVDYNVYHPDISTGKVTIGDQVFHVTKELLSYHSPLFHQLFQSSSEIELTDINRHDFRRILNMIYPTQLLPNSWDGRMEKKELLASITRMLEFAHKYGIDIVKEMIEKYVHNQYWSDVMEWKFLTADRLAMPNLLISEYNTEKFMRTPDYQLVSKKMQNLLWEKSSWNEKYEKVMKIYEALQTEQYGEGEEKERQVQRFRMAIIRGIDV